MNIITVFEDGEWNTGNLHEKNIMTLEPGEYVAVPKDKVLYEIDYDAADEDLDYGADWYPNKIDRMVRQRVLKRVWPEPQKGDNE